MVTAKPHGRLLIVDDDPWTRTVMTALLIDEGYAVIQAKNGEDALEMATRERPDLVLLDLALPTMSGLEVLRELKTKADTTGTPVFILSAYASLMEQQDVQRADAVLQKPFDYDELIELIARTTRTADQRQPALQR